jgi:uncharacterized protein (TIGR03083 family)
MNGPEGSHESLRRSITAQRQDLAEILDALSLNSWEAPTLCEGWKVREVVAHLTMPFRYSTARFIGEVLRSGGKFNRMADRCARRDSALSPEELTTAVRDNAMNPWKPPGGGFEGALVHEVIHGLDITVPLRIEHAIPADRLRTVLHVISRPKSLKFFGVDLTGINLHANDVEWSFGSGVSMSGSAQAIALVLCGRTLPA